jgi:hypothetical protein
MLHALHSLDGDFDALPYCYADSSSRDAAPVRERALWCAVLERALADAGKIDLATSVGMKVNPKNIEFREAVKFLERDRVDFPLVCELVGVNPAVIRQGVARIER